MDKKRTKMPNSLEYTFDYTQNPKSFQSLKEGLLEKMSQHPDQEFYLVFNASMDSAYRQYLETLARRHNKKLESR